MGTFLRQTTRARIGGQAHTDFIPAAMDSADRQTARSQLADRFAQSPRMVAQRAFSESIERSPRMVAQRAQMARTVQRQDAEEEPLQGRFASVQRAGVEEEEPMQGRFFNGKGNIQRKEEAAPNNTGLPDGLKSGIENLSGYAMDNVKVHYNSSKPSQLQAHAYAQGSDIHVAPGQERHLPHEAWHVVQQKQGRVTPTVQAKGVPVNDDAGLEQEADVMGAKALQQKKDDSAGMESVQLKNIDSADTVQLNAFEDNLEVQGLKPQVDALEAHITGGTLTAQTLSALQALDVAVSRSIQLRTRLAAELGTDPGHAARIVIETGFRTTLRAEIATKEAAAAAARRRAENARLAAAPSLLPPGARWGGAR